MKELAQKQQRASQKSPVAQSSPIPPIKGDSPTPAPSQPEATATEPPARVETPLERTLLELLSDKDLGATGFVTANELEDALAALPDNKAVSFVIV